MLLATTSTNFLVNAGAATMDRDLQHGHSKEYFEKTKLRAPQTPNGSPLVVHLVPHSHDDVGWLKTVDQYFTGSEYKIQGANVQLLITNVIDELLKDSSKRFSFVEMKFFSMWWKYQTEEMKNQVR